ncbi:hypothetical protein [Pseudodesulfovibrio sp.]|uniref:hypothetical protein n=1 Tax=Pseudodesulfovibrio sp. TaxID=2035812 RepID=UPI002627B23F|nr:hypothetical protein [Pseudodesulfovibrio sp.]MDD3313136.1 hypothetical protein [Pseudodesulfovibrio sp.]
MIKSVSIKNAVRDTVEIFQFDQWMRFYFVKGEGEDLRVEIPEDVMEQVKADHPALYRLADISNNGAIDYQRSQENVCSYVAAHLGGEKYDATVLPQVFDNAAFKIEMYIFNVWLKMHEAHLDEEYLDFGQWLEMYEGWNSLDEVKAYRKKLLENGTDPGMPACGTAQ